jgi:hypothetical protein
MLLQKYAVLHLLRHRGGLLKLGRLLVSTKVQYERPRLKVQMQACHVKRSYNISAEQVDIREVRVQRRRFHFDAILVVQANVYPPR